MAEVTKGRIFFSDSEKDVKKKMLYLSIKKEREREYPAEGK